MMIKLRTILSEVSGKPYADTETGSIQHIINKIKKYLANKRYNFYSLTWHAIM